MLEARLWWVCSIVEASVINSSRFGNPTKSTHSIASYTMWIIGHSSRRHPSYHKSLTSSTATSNKLNILQNDPHKYSNVKMADVIGAPSVEDCSHRHKGSPYYYILGQFYSVLSTDMPSNMCCRQFWLTIYSSFLKTWLVHYFNFI